MTISIDRAVAAFEDGFSCSQAVCSAYAPALGLSRDLALKIAAGFGGGLGRCGEVCGAVTGAIMVIGLNTGPIEATDSAGKEHTYELTHQLIDRFKARHGSIGCRELLGYNLSQPEELQRAREARLFENRCPQFVRNAAEIVAELLEGK